MGTSRFDGLSPLVREALARLRTRVESALGPIEVRLFGSYARGEANEYSDVDVLVVIPEATGPSRSVVGDAAAQLFVELGLLVNPVVMGRADFLQRVAAGNPFLRTILAEGIAA